MTDFGKPTTAAQALRTVAEAIDSQIKRYEQKIREHQAVIEALREEWGSLLSDAASYERYQPKPEEGTHDDG